MKLSCLYEDDLGPEFSRRSFLKGAGAMGASALAPGSALRVVKDLLSPIPVSLLDVSYYPEEFNPDGFLTLWEWSNGFKAVTGEKSVGLFDAEGNQVGHSWRGAFDQNSPAAPYFKQMMSHYDHNKNEVIEPDIDLWMGTKDMSVADIGEFEELAGFSPREDALHWEREESEYKTKHGDYDNPQGRPTNFELHDPYESKKHAPIKD